MEDPTSKRRTIVIIGAGIIGATTAYYLTRHPSYSSSTHRIILLEPSDVAGGASGKAGGLLGLWAYPRCLVPLSFRLHRELAREHGGERRWGYRGVWCGEVECKGTVKGAGKPLAKREGLVKGGGEEEEEEEEEEDSDGVEVEMEKPWVDESALVGYEAMGSPEDTAQVHPRLFTQAMVELAVEKGVELIRGKAESLNYRGGTTASEKITQKDKMNNDTTATRRVLESVAYVDAAVTPDSTDQEKHTIPTNTAIITAGPWTPSLLPSLPISPVRAHSIVIKPTSPIPAHALFTSITVPPAPSTTSAASPKKKTKTKRPKTVTPEIYPRPDGTVYACGPGDTNAPLPIGGTSHVLPDETSLDDLKAQVGSICGALAEGELLARQACYLPTVEGTVQGPFVGRVGGGCEKGGEKGEGVWVGSGHTCWGIQNGPATGLLLSEMVMEGKARSADVSSLDPKQVLEMM